VILDFERPIKDFEERIAELRRLAGPSAELRGEISRLEEALDAARRRIYSNLSPYQRVQVARHPERPNFRAYRDALADDFYELSGDRLFGDDPVLIGHDKGTDVNSRVKGNFGMAHPEGYRKVNRFYELAARFGLPVVVLVDTPGAFAGRGAEERGQAWAISADLMALARIPVPVVSVIIGEGCSGGALAMCATDYVGMLENSYLSVIAPEACASIIFRDPSRAAEAAEALKLTATDMKGRGIVDEVLPEPLGGAHNDPEAAIEAVGRSLDRVLTGLSDADPDALLEARYERYRSIGAHTAIGEDPSDAGLSG
jgi:acetyl-CoA carboxylase carboxyl transferase subunit alpha